MNYQCRRCGCNYGKEDSLFVDGDWNPADGKCYGCYQECVLYEIFGGILEPCFVVNGIAFMADCPPFNWEEELSSPENECPF